MAPAGGLSFSRLENDEHEYRADVPSVIRVTEISIWYLEKAYPGTSLNIVAGTLRIKGGICYPPLVKALNFLVMKNDSMRLRVCEKDGAAMQYLTDYEEFDVEYFDFSGGGLDELFAWDEKTTRTPFELSKIRCFTAPFFKVGDEEGGAYMKIHHLISDAWTMGLPDPAVRGLLREVLRRTNVDITPNPSFIAHIADEQDYENSARFLNDRAYGSEIPRRSRI